ncbi:Uncharacterized protein Rs2_06250 [Raphanus sativus]|nr:Uncharacterized protein Rs2_06250 [Raphanus sativus]
MEQPEYYPRWGHEIVSDAEDHPRARNADLQARRRKPVAKRHIRPTAGGAPLVSCYHCSQNLQLPADYLIFKRKYHLLRWGTCTTSPRERAPSNPENPSSSPAQEEEGEEVPVARGSPLHGLINGIFYC